MSSNQRTQSLLKSIFNGRRAIIAIPYLWLLMFFMLPFIFVLKISLAEPIMAIPPYTALLEWGDSLLPSIRASLESYLFLFSDSLYIKAYLSSLKIAIISTILTLIIGYSIAYSVAKAPTRWRGILLMLVILPFWTSFLIRVYAWIGILKTEGLLNLALMSIGIIDKPLIIMNATRLEFRLPSADSNPYLVFASILSSVLSGIENKYPLGKETIGNAHAQHKSELPQSFGFLKS